MLALLRFLTVVALLAFLVGLADPVAVQFVTRGATRVEVELPDNAADPAAAALPILAAAARAGPRAAELTLRAERPGVDLPAGPLGAELVVESEPLPFEPTAIELTAGRPPAVGRPVELTLGFATGLAASPGPGGHPVAITVNDAVDQALAERGTLAAASPVTVTFVPARAGAHRVAAAVEVGDRTLTLQGSFDVQAAPRVLVLEPSGNAAAALAAQGLAVTAPTLRSEAVIDVALLDGLDDHAAVVVGLPLGPAAATRLAAAIDEGLGAFVLAPAFGEAGQVLHDLLPLLPEPLGATAAGATGDGAGSASGPATGEPVADPAAGDPVTGDPSPRDPGANESAAAEKPDPAPAVTEPERPPDAPPSGEIEEPTPVSDEPIEVDKRSIAMVLVVDRSYSMGHVVGVQQRSKMSYAKTSALESARALTVGDQVAIVTFGNKGASRVEMPLTDAEESAAIRAGVARLAHGPEQTFLLAGLQAAGELLKPATAAVKHVVVVTDGEFRTDETFALRALAHRLFREHGISCSILSIVDDSTNTEFAIDAASITQDGGGQFFAIPAAEQVPVFVSAEVARSLDRAGRGDGGPGDGEGAGEPAAEPETPTDPPTDPPTDQDGGDDESETPDPPPDDEPNARVPVRAVARSPLLAPRPGDGPGGTWPTLGAAVPTTAPLDAAVLLVAGDEGWPLLCFGNRGLGRIGAFAADLCGPAGAELRAESAFPARLTLWVQHVMRAEPRAEPITVLLEWQLDEPAPLPSGVLAFERLGGTSAVTATANASLGALRPNVARRVESRLPDWALLALGLVLLLAVVERLAVMRGRVA